jgi:DNA-binding MarR family transcriptional regulator
MLRDGWITKEKGPDRRAVRLRLTKAGQAQFKRALPVWERVQAQLRIELGSEQWEKLLSLANSVTSVLTESGDLS